MADCGIDFGTTNSLVSCVVGGKARALTHEGRPHPSVIWYHGTQTKVGREAREMLDSNAIGVAGEFIRSPKSMLGKGQTFDVGRRVVRPIDATGDVFKHLRKHAESRQLEGLRFDRAVVTIPVDMRGSARRELREAARIAGIAIEQFVHEPFAALYGYARRSGNPTEVLARLQGRHALVFDWGGGTLDLTLCECVGNILVQVQNVGNSRIGGDRFDERLMHLAVSRHMERYAWTQRREMVRGQEAKLLASCEQAKITLSSRQSATVLVKSLFVGKDMATDLEIEISQEDFTNEVQDLLDAGLHQIKALLDSAGQSLQSVEICLPTGGVVAMPVVKERLLRLFGPSRCEFVERADTLIADGAAWVAAGNVPLKLGKNLEFRHANQTWVPIIKSGYQLPKGNQAPDPVSLTLFCADPRNGTAHIEIARPKRPSGIQAADPRQCYELMRVDVDRQAPPLREAIDLTLTIDPDLIVHVFAVGQATRRKASTEIHDLEFGLSLALESPPSDLGEVGRPVRSGGNGHFDTRVQGIVREFVAAQQQVHGQPWVSIADRVYVNGRQESLEAAIGRAFKDEYKRPFESAVTLLQGLGVPCVERAGVWIVANPGQSTTPQVLAPASLGPANSVLVRSNVTQHHDDLQTIPGDLVDEHYPGFTGSMRVTARQLDELRWSNGTTKRRPPTETS